MRKLKRGLMFFGVVLLLAVPYRLPAQPLHSAEPEFDGQSAFTFLYRQVELGPRVPGSEPHRQTIDMIVDWMKRAGGDVRLQTFTADIHTAPRADAPTRAVQGTNIIAHFGEPGRTDLLLAAHFDTRPWADMESDPAKAMQPVPGANDGASGVAVLMELARLFSESPPPINVDLVFFDIEDAGISGNNETYCLGSSYFARNHAGSPPRGGVLLDMIGDNDLEIPQEYFSLAYAKEWTETVFRVAREVDAWAFYDAPGDAVYDDHVPLLRAGFPMVDLIDFDYEYWHTTSDLPQACSPESLEQVGRVLTRLVYGGVLQGGGR